jgi:excisionase family DNA binding protein
MLFQAPYGDYWLSEEIAEQLGAIRSAAERIEARLEQSEEIDPRRRYSLDEAGKYLGVSKRTLRRRAEERRIAFLRDGKRPYVMGAELLRYARKPGGRS